MRRYYRELLFTTKGLENHISGVILFEESTEHCLKNGTPFIDHLAKKGILSGIKVDKG